jgi:hypothetical protein
MKRVLLTILVMQIFSFADFITSSNLDSLKQLSKTSIPDTTKVIVCADISFTYAFLQVDTSIAYAQAISLATIQYKVARQPACLLMDGLCGPRGTTIKPLRQH